MDVIKKKSYYPLCIQNERNETVGARGNEIVNTLVPVFCIEVWSWHEMIRHHVHEYIMPTRPPRHTTIWNPSNLPPSSSLEWKLSFFHIFFGFLLHLVQNSCNIYDTNELFVSKWIIKLNKMIKKFYMDFNLT